MNEVSLEFYFGSTSCKHSITMNQITEYGGLWLNIVHYWNLCLQYAEVDSTLFFYGMVDFIAQLHSWPTFILDRDRLRGGVGIGKKNISNRLVTSFLRWTRLLTSLLNNNKFFFWSLEMLQKIINFIFNIKVFLVFSSYSNLENLFVFEYPAAVLAIKNIEIQLVMEEKIYKHSVRLAVAGTDLVWEKNIIVGCQ